VLEFAEYSLSRTKKLAADSGSTLKRQFTPNRDAEPWKGLAAGLIAGFVGTAAMTAFQVAWLKGKSELEKIEADDPSKVQQSVEGESATAKVADIVSQEVRGRKLNKNEKEPASYAVHFAFGTIVGGIYGLTSEYLPVAKLGKGLLHGLGVWVGADALALPGLGLSRPVSERSAGELSYEILSHAVFGVGSELTRKTVREWMD
jgi:putative membrane protein